MGKLTYRKPTTVRPQGPVPARVQAPIKAPGRRPATAAGPIRVEAQGRSHTVAPTRSAATARTQTAKLLPRTTTIMRCEHDQRTNLKYRAQYSSTESIFRIGPFHVTTPPRFNKLIIYITTIYGTAILSRV